MGQLKKYSWIFSIIFIVCMLTSFFPVFIQLGEARYLGLFSWNHSFTRADLALYWAPVWYQDTHSSDPSELDYITNFNFDGNWRGNDNWDNLYSYDLKAYIYFSVVETETHWFIGYYDFHPRDWTHLWSPADCHENDMEGVLLVITKTGDYGSLLLMETEAHNHIYQYSNEALADGTDNIDGDVESEYLSTPASQGGTLWNYHPLVFVEDQGHGVHGNDDWNKDDFPGNDGVVYKPRGIVELGLDDKYYPEGIAEEPSGRNDRDVGYALIDIGAKGDLWDRRFNIGEGDTYGAFGKFDGDDYMDDAASTPWRWDDGDDGPTFTGEIFYNPADMVDQHLNGLGEFDHDYVYNPYCIRVTINTYEVKWDRDGSNDLSDGYLNLHMVDGEGHFTPDDGVLDGDSGSQFSWIGWDFPRYTEINMSDRIPRSFYGIRYPGQYYFGFKSRDWDPGSGDEWLMGDYNGGYHEEDYLHMYGSELREGMHFLDWGGSNVWITLAGDVGDDDEEAPYFILDSAYSHPELVPSNYSGSITFSVNLTDASGISEAVFEFKGENDQNWTREQATMENNPIDPGHGFILRYNMNQTTWTNYYNQTIYFRWWAMDNDDERPDDALDAYSPVFEGPEIEPAPEPIIPLWMLIIIGLVIAFLISFVIFVKRKK
ncbi:MAG: hypothetical protein JSV05_03060 [Candidatus Bathyarchaeota archaeon]|nr:MAG: hypothetical protein JSV05_03060 [Candidatus Bathyarchaeota archaeon]